MELEFPNLNGRLLGGSIPAGSLFATLPNSIQQEFSEISSRKHFEKYTTVVSDKQKPGIFVLTEGRAELIHFNNLNRRYIFQSLRNHEMIGLTETLANQPFRMTLKSVTPCSFQTVDSQAFIAFLRVHPGFAFQLAKVLGDDICTTARRFSGLSFY